MPFGAAHWWDLIPLILLGLLIFGPKRLPEMGASIGKSIKEFQKSMREVTSPSPPPAPAMPLAPSDPVTPELTAPGATSPSPALAPPVGEHMDASGPTTPEPLREPESTALGAVQPIG